MTELPHGLTDPLHLLEPFPWRALTLLALALALAVVFFTWRHRRRGAVPVVAPPAVSAPPQPSGVLGELERLRRHHDGVGSYRRGCHELSELLRTHLERVHGRPFTVWTAREATEAEGDTLWTRLLGLLSDLQFARRPPRRSDFEGIYDLARDALSSGSER